MPLRDLQTALGTLVLARASGVQPAATWPSLDGISLSADERVWLKQLVGSPGFEVTCHIQRWWRETRLKYAAPLTLAALVLDHHREILHEYLDANAPPSLFFAPEALQFLDFAIDRAPEQSHLRAIARFERAIRVAAEAALMSSGQTDEVVNLRPTQPIKQHPAASLVEFASPPERVLGVLLTGEPLPPLDGQSHLILVAPGLPYWWRPATTDEARLFNLCQSSITVEQVLNDSDRLTHTLHELIHIGALCADRSSTANAPQPLESECSPASDSLAHQPTPMGLENSRRC
jgi:hypothetical protein